MQSPKRDQARVTARVTNDVAATPRATLKVGLVQHQWGVGLGSRMLHRFMAATGPRPQVSHEFLVRCIATRRVRR
jgi:hypothetical protein